MRTQAICLVLAIVLVCPFASAQWVKTSLPDSDRVYCFAVSGTNLFAGTDHGVFLTTDNGTIWTAVNRGLIDTWVDALAVYGMNLFAGTGGVGGVYLYTDYDTSWYAVNEGLPKYDFAPYRYLTIQCFASSGQNLFAGALGGGVYLYTDYGASWTAASTGLPSPTWVKSLAVSGTNLIAGTDGDGVFLSTDNGASWTVTGLTNNYVRALTIAGMNVFAGTVYGVFLSTDNGTSWTVTGLRDRIYFLAVSNTNLFAGSGSIKADSVYLSTDGGGSWRTVGVFGGLDALVVSDTNLFAGTVGGVWRRPLSEMITTVEGPSTDLPAQFSLHQNYPNPFNPSTTIKFELSRASHVSLTVYDILGRQVSVLVNEKRDAGVHEVKFDGSNLASGLYFYRLQVGDFVQSKKMLMLK